MEKTLIQNIDFIVWLFFQKLWKNHVADEN